MKKKKYSSESGMGTVEILIILVLLVTLAMIFRSNALSFVKWIFT